MRSPEIHPRREGQTGALSGASAARGVRVRQGFFRRRPRGLVRASRLRLQSRGGEPAQGSFGVRGRELLVRRGASGLVREERQPLLRDAGLLRPGVPRGALRRQRVRQEQARGGEGPSRARGAHRRARADLPLPERLRQVVPPSLQQRGGHVLPSGRAWRGADGRRPLDLFGAALHRRPCDGDARRAAGRGASLRLRGAGGRPERGGPFLPRARHRQGHVGRDRVDAEGV